MKTNSTEVPVPPIWTFTGWFRSEKRRFKIMLASIGIGPVLLALLWEKVISKHLHIPQDWRDTIPYIANLFIIGVACWLIQQNKAGYPKNWLTRNEKPLDDATKEGVEASAYRFQKKWLLVWVSWVALYLVYLVFSLPLFQQGPAPTPSAVQTNAAAQAPAKVAPATEKPTGGKTLNDKPKAQYWRTALTNVAGGLNTLFFLACYFALLRFYKPQADGTIDKQDLPTAPMAYVFMLFLAADIVLLVMKSNAAEYTDGLRVASFLLEVAYGMFAAVVFALFVGRIESKYISVPLPAILGLYFYAMLQVCLATLTAANDHLLIPENIKKDISLTVDVGYQHAAVLKGLFFLVMHWLITCGGLLYYFQMMLQADEAQHDEIRKKLIKAIYLEKHNIRLVETAAPMIPPESNPS